jgi:hypothetical protein
MKGKWVLCVLVAILGLVSWQTMAGATLYRMRFQVNTVQRPGTKWLNVNIQVSDSVKRPYDAVQSLTVTGPEPDAIPVNLTENWNEGAQAYTWGSPPLAADVPGTYTAEVVGNDANQSTITQTATINGTFLNIPVITAPLTGATEISLTPTITWNAVTGAQYYNLFIQQTSPSQPQWSATYPVYRTSFTVPAGILKPGATYKINLNAFDSDKLMTKQSQSLDVIFYTAP